MSRRTATLILAALMLSACAGGPTAGPKPEISRAYEDLEGAKPANLVRVSHNELVGRPVQGSGASPGELASLPHPSQLYAVNRFRAAD